MSIDDNTWKVLLTILLLGIAIFEFGAKHSERSSKASEARSKREESEQTELGKFRLELQQELRNYRDEVRGLKTDLETSRDECFECKKSNVELKIALDLMEARMLRMEEELKVYRAT